VINAEKNRINKVLSNAEIQAMVTAIGTGIADEFDISVFQDLPLDHGLHSPLTMMWPTKPDWPARVVPLVVNVVGPSVPLTGLRIVSPFVPSTRTSNLVLRGTGFPDWRKAVVLSKNGSDARIGFSNGATATLPRAAALLAQVQPAAGDPHAGRQCL